MNDASRWRIALGRRLGAAFRRRPESACGDGRRLHRARRGRSLLGPGGGRVLERRPHRR